MKTKDHLLEKINTKTAVVGVIGLGYVGLPLAVEKANAGFRTIGFDIQEDLAANSFSNSSTFLPKGAIQFVSNASCMYCIS